MVRTLTAITQPLSCLEDCMPSLYFVPVALLCFSLVTTQAHTEITLDSLHPEGGMHFDHPGVMSSADCWQRCQQNSSCQLMVYSRQYQGCYLRGPFSPAWRIWPEGFSI